MWVFPLQPVHLVSMATIAASRVLSVSTVTGRATTSPATANVFLAFLAPSATKVSWVQADFSEKILRKIGTLRECLNIVEGFGLVKINESL